MPPAVTKQEMHFADTIFLQAGCYSIRIEDSQHLLRDMPVSWQRYLLNKAGAESPTASLILREIPPPQETVFAEGWNAVRRNEWTVATFVMKGNPFFALSYTQPAHVVTVSVFQLSGISVRIALNYAVMLVLSKRCIGLHGVTLLCSQEFITLSAPSGTGKTTLSHLLERYSDAVVLNGDFALLSPAGDEVIFEPTPFCGSSGRCLNYRLPISRIVFLAQSSENHWHTLASREALSLLMSNTFVPEWDSELSQSVLGLVMKVLPRVKLNQYAFAPTQEAAEIFQDKLLDESERK